MRQVALINRNGTRDLFDVYYCTEFPFDKLDKSLLKASKRRKIAYYEHCMTFDIESTSMFDKTQHCFGFMYIWQACVQGVLTYGRTWGEFQGFMRRLSEELELGAEKKLVVYVHNLSFEFQFMRQFINLESVFATEKRKVLKVTTKDGFEFRCSYRLTNMSLSKACENEKGVIHVKADDDLDYDVIRTPKTKLNDVEFGYCMSDVQSLYELIENRCINEKDNLRTIPLTSTSYVRREVRNIVNKDAKYKALIKSCALNKLVYQMLVDCGRGGNTHANPFLSGHIISGVDSFDVVSSYPSQMILQDRYPISNYRDYGQLDTMKEFRTLMKKYSCLFYIELKNVCIKCGVVIPYIAKDKCLNLINPSIDNGRVLMCDSCYMCINEIDFAIIEKQYTFDEINVKTEIAMMHVATKGRLPKPLRDAVMNYFVQKCELKKKIKKAERENAPQEVIDDLNYYYAKSKNRLNSIFGMCYTNPLHDVVKYDVGADHLWSIEKVDIEQGLDDYNKKYSTFLFYAWGMTITSLAREWLETLLDACGTNCIYCDTDSSKCIHDDEIEKRIEELNEKIKILCVLEGGYCDVDGERFYLGLYEKENKEPLKKFITLGAKKYAYVDEKGLHATISGVNKKIGKTELGRIENFYVGFQFRDSASKEVTYNDVNPYIIKVKGTEIVTGANIGISDSTYTLGITDTYAELIGIDMEEYE